MIVTKPRDWNRIKANLAEIDAKSVFIMGCGECATVAHTGGQAEIMVAKARLEAEGYSVTGSAVGAVTCHSGGVNLDMRKHRAEVDAADAVLVLSCGAGVQTVADAVKKPTYPGLESAFLGNVVRHGVFEERCQMCGDCVLDKTAGICPVTTCPKGLLNGPCGGMWNGMCEVLTDRECAHVKIRRRLAEQGRGMKGVIAPKDYSVKRGPGSVNTRDAALGRKPASTATDKPFTTEKDA
ncbi:MAG: methylenetetrahydrofolate reductase C-terminal domain-containing protein [Coriobacteriia bacterium]|nr:methylenetetrahydrofolate reductase C-terminal domain-containing protein [Coriobacteriia bacterium]